MLTVYSASAGSGKTYTLARRILDVLLREPDAYQRLLAVTFTRKAALEMKQRVIGDLYLLAHDDQSSGEKRRDLLAYHAASTGLGEADIVGAARVALKRILNDLAQLSISTIDSFVQRVLRSFAYDQGLAASYSLAIDKEQVQQAAIDATMQEMQSNAVLQRYMLNYSNRLDEEGKRLVTLERALANSAADLEEHVDDLQGLDMATCENFVKAIQERLDMLESHAAECQRQLALVAQGLAGPLDQAFDRKESSKIYKACVDPSQIWDLADYAPNNKKIFRSGDQLIYGAEEAQIRALARQVADMAQLRGSLVAVKEKIDILGVLGTVAQHQRRLCQEANIMLIADQAELLSRLIDGASIPFIYERVGVRYEQIMIDEFQDTNLTQYLNFRPLLCNSLDQGYPCLLVGDVKQSIYRFRSGDWRLLAQRVPADFPDASQCNLDCNFRSRQEIVLFNNALFGHLPALMERGLAEGSDHTHFADLYRQSRQQPRRGPGGVVRVKIYGMGCKQGHSDGLPGEVDVRSHILRQCVATIREQTATCGRRLSDIALLVRSGADAAAVNDALAAEGWPVVSDNALRVVRSTAVRAVVDALRFLHTGEKVHLFGALCVLTGVEADALAATYDEVRDVWEPRLTELKGLGLTEQVAAVIAMLPETLATDEMAFLEVLEQKTLEAVSQGAASLDDFLELYDQEADKWYTSAPEGGDALHLLTIHKAKGLEFPVVIVPFADYTLKGQSDTVWMSKSALGDLAALYPGERLPVKYVNGLERTGFHDEWCDERRLRYIDALNLAYVALTRPTEALYVMGVAKHSKSEKPELPRDSLSLYLEAALPQLMEELPGETLLHQVEESVTWEEDGVSASGPVKCTVLALGTAPYAARPTEPKGPAEGSTRTLAAMPHRLLTAVVSFTSQVDADMYGPRAELVSYGLTMHSLLQRIERLGDVPDAVAQAVTEGLVEEHQAQTLVDELNTRLADPAVSAWFDGSCQQVYNETTLIGHNQRLRPDRVMVTPDGGTLVVDFKFGRQRNPRHRDQVRQYSRWLASAGFQHVRAKLWYYTLGVIEEVSD